MGKKRKRARAEHDHEQARVGDAGVEGVIEGGAGMMAGPIGRCAKSSRRAVRQRRVGARFII